MSASTSSYESQVFITGKPWLPAKRPYGNATSKQEMHRATLKAPVTMPSAGPQEVEEAAQKHKFSLWRGAWGKRNVLESSQEQAKAKRQVVIDFSVAKERGFPAASTFPYALSFKAPDCEESSFAGAQSRAGLPSAPQEAPLLNQRHKVKYVYFMRHCFSCSNGRGLISGGRLHLPSYLKTKAKTPFCDHQGVLEPMDTAQKLVEELHETEKRLAELGLPLFAKKFLVGSSMLLRAMQTAAIAALGLRTKNVDVGEHIYRIPYIIEQSNMLDRNATFLRNTQNKTDLDTSSKVAEGLNRWIQDLNSKMKLTSPTIDEKTCLPSPCPSGVQMSNNSSKQWCQFLTKVVPDLPDSQHGVSLIVSHGGTMRKGLLQGVLLQEKGKLSNPHPSNTETFLCAFLMDESNMCYKMVVVDRIVPRKNAGQGLASMSNPLQESLDVGQKCSKTLNLH